MCWVDDRVTCGTLATVHVRNVGTIVASRSSTVSSEPVVTPGLISVVVMLLIVVAVPLSVTTHAPTAMWNCVFALEAVAYVGTLNVHVPPGITVPLPWPGVSTMKPVGAAAVGGGGGGPPQRAGRGPPFSHNT